MKIELFYDKECPFCNSYAKYIKLKEKHELTLKNVREHSLELKEFKALGFDINDGFIIRINDIDICQGVNAIVFLNDLANKKVFFPDNYFFRNIIYPLIKQLRRLVLKIMRKQVDL